ncbi:MAG: phosphotransferase [Microbacterium sp.]
MEEVELTGGNMQPVVRVGDTVRRVAGEWTPAVHALLERLAAAGVAETPRALGFDAQGREVLSFIDGVVLEDSSVPWSHEVLTAAGRLLRRIHDASAPLADDETLVWRSPRREPAEVVCHNDFATYNLIARDDALVGVIDFDFASPGSRLWDLAYLAYRIVPFVEDARHPGDLDRTGRLEALVAAYGVPFTRAEVLRTAADRLDDLRAFTLDRAAETGREDFVQHAAMYGRDAASLRAAASMT